MLPTVFVQVDLAQVHVGAVDDIHIAQFAAHAVELRVYGHTKVYVGVDSVTVSNRRNTCTGSRRGATEPGLAALPCRTPGGGLRGARKIGGGERGGGGGAAAAAGGGKTRDERNFTTSNISSLDYLYV